MNPLSKFDYCVTILKKNEIKQVKNDYLRTWHIIIFFLTLATNFFLSVLQRHQYPQNRHFLPIWRQFSQNCNVIVKFRRNFSRQNYVGKDYSHSYCKMVLNSIIINLFTLKIRDTSRVTKFRVIYIVKPCEMLLEARFRRFMISGRIWVANLIISNFWIITYTEFVVLRSRGQGYARSRKLPIFIRNALLLDTYGCT